MRHLEQLHAFVIAATKELMWLNDKEEEEVTYDWSERNTNMTAKKENYSVREYITQYNYKFTKYYKLNI